MRPALLLVSLMALNVSPGRGQTPLPPRAVQVLVTVTKIRPGAPPIQPSDLSVRQGKTTIPVLGWERVRPQVQLWIAIDDDSEAGLADHIGEVREFILHLPVHTQAGLAYLGASGVQIAAPLNADHRAVAARLRPPKSASGASPDPYASLQALFNQWPNTPGVRRELLVFTPGSVFSGGPNDTHNPAVQTLIVRAQRENIVIFGLSVGTAGDPLGLGQGGENQPSLGAQGGGNTMNSPAATPVMEALAGQSNLREVSEQSGGWWDYLLHTMMDLRQKLAQVESCIQHQFWVVYVPPADAPAGLAKIKVECKTKGTGISAPGAVTIP
ncbi:MAG: hypothetical protein ACRD1L_03775 [Terriglobales bacterium]